MENKSYEVWFIHTNFSLYFFVGHAESQAQAVRFATLQAREENVPNWMTETETNVEKFDVRQVY